jgi:excisionase family DNA binding protein
VKSHTIIRSPGAIALCAFFAGVTAFVLFKDVLDGAAVTIQHILSLAALVAALASGHKAMPELKSGRVVSAVTLALLFVASTSYIVISSGARNAETADRGSGSLRSPLEKRGYRMNEAVRYTGLSRSTLYELINDGTLPDLKIAGRRILPGEALDKLFEGAERK